jgi:nicotinate-nucleotide pyrophosphorylase (carboxylating)
MQLSEEQIDNIIDLALTEDTSHGDITSQLLIPKEQQGKASVLIKEDGILAGIEVAGRTFLKVDPTLEFEVLIEDGTQVKTGDIVAAVSGNVSGILTAERVALNFLQRLSGIASETAKYVAMTAGYKARITDTRKTTPGIRLLEKYAVRMGGGHNHRFHLGDGILIKDNHLAALRAISMNLKDIVEKAKQSAPSGIKVEIEVTTTVEAMEAAEAGADIVMLDNMSIDEMGHTIELISSKVKFEASGGIRLDNVRNIAATGVDIISVGALTHSSKSLDISIELEPQTLKLI